MKKDINVFLSGLGLRIKEARNKKGLTQHEVAGFTQTKLSRYERGDVSPTAETLMVLAVQLEVSADWLLTGEGEMARGALGVTPSVSVDEVEWLHRYRNLTPEQRVATGLIIEQLVCFNKRSINDKQGE